MDSYDIFRKLTSGIKFDTKRFEDVAQIFQIGHQRKKVKEEIKTENKDESVKQPKRKREEDESDSENDKDKINGIDKNDSNDENDENVFDDSDLENNGKDENGQVKNENKSEKSSSNVLTLLDGITAAEDGKIIRPKKKQKVMTEDKKLRQEHQRINEYRNKHHIHVTGTNVPAPIETFEQLSTNYNVKSVILQNMASCKYQEPTPIQMQTIPVMLEQRNLLACAPTGSGKTAAFLLPVIHQLKEHKKTGFRAVVLAPTRELAQQIYRECLRLTEGLKLGIFISRLSKDALEKFGQKNSQKYDIIISTPQRLITLLNQESNPISLTKVEWLVVDEADKLFEEGNRAFKSQLEGILKACENPELRCAMFSATNPVEVTHWSRHNLRQLVTITIGRKNTVAETIEQELIYVGNEQGKLIEIRKIFQKGIAPPVLIFVQSKERAHELFKELIYDGINVDAIHADRTQTQRDNVVRCFREGKIWVLICTELMGRGIDFKGVNLVINYDFPRSTTSYIHRIGRTGRAGHTGKAITFFTQQDIDYLKSIAKVMRESGCEVPEYMFHMKQYSKKQRRKIENTAPDRENICTIPGFKRRSKEKFKNKKRMEKKLAEASKNQDSTNSKGTKNVNKVNFRKKFHKKESMNGSESEKPSQNSSDSKQKQSLRENEGRKKKKLVKKFPKKD